MKKAFCDLCGERAMGGPAYIHPSDRHQDNKFRDYFIQVHRRVKCGDGEDDGDFCARCLAALLRHFADQLFPEVPPNTAESDEYRAGKAAFADEWRAGKAALAKVEAKRLASS